MADPQYFYEGRKHLRSPIIMSIRARKTGGTLRAGVDALSEREMSKPPETSVGHQQARIRAV